MRLFCDFADVKKKHWLILTKRVLGLEDRDRLRPALECMAGDGPPTSNGVREEDEDDFRVEEVRGGRQ